MSWEAEECESSRIKIFLKNITIYLLEKLNFSFKFFSSSPELKVQVYFSDHLLSVVHLSGRPSENFAHFWVLKHHRAKFNQTWYFKHTYGRGILNCWIGINGQTLFKRGDNPKTLKKRCVPLKILFSRTILHQTCICLHQIIIMLRGLE